MEKTAMQVLLNDVKVEYESFGQIRLGWLLQRINNLRLFEEKRQLTNAYDAGKSHEANGTINEINQTGDEYYSSTFQKHKNYQWHIRSNRHL